MTKDAESINVTEAQHAFAKWQDAIAYELVMIDEWQAVFGDDDGASASAEERTEATRKWDEATQATRDARLNVERAMGRES